MLEIVVHINRLALWHKGQQVVTMEEPVGHSQGLARTGVGLAEVFSSFHQLSHVKDGRNSHRDK
jgi:hypothetical protein